MSEDHEHEECAACEGEDESHDCGWVNDDCPDQCSTEHTAEREYVLTCPETGTHWRYCDRCGWEEVRYSWVDDPTYVNGELLCTPYDHGYDLCGECDQWVNEEDMRYSEHDECSYCSDCYRSGACGYGNRDGEDVHYCDRCQTYDRNMLLLSEEFVCHCRAVAAHAAGEPVQFDPGQGVSAPLTFLSNIARLAGHSSARHLEVAA